jgi:hypothetical protein
MATERRRLLLLGTLAVVLIAVIVRMVWPATSSAPAAASNRAGTAAAAPARRSPNAPAAPVPPGVHLDALNAQRPKPETERNLFRFKPKAPPPPPAGAARTAPPPAAALPAAPAGPPPPPPLAPITLKFIGIVESPSHGEKIAILSDGRNAPFYGKEGAIIEGRFRILKIGVESVELAYADGRGRQTIRLTGS